MGVVHEEAAAAAEGIESVDGAAVALLYIFSKIRSNLYSPFYTHRSIWVFRAVLRLLVDPLYTPSTPSTPTMLGPRSARCPPTVSISVVSRGQSLVRLSCFLAGSCFRVNGL